MLLTLVSGLNGAAFQPTLCVVGGGPLSNSASLKGVGVHELPMYSGKKDLYFLCRLVMLIRKCNPDIIHSHIWLTNLYASLCGVILKIPVVSTFHTNHHTETVFEVASLKLIHHLSSKIVLVCNHQARVLGFAENSPKVVVIHNGVRLREASSGSKRLILRELGKDEAIEADRRKLLVVIGNLRPVKGHVFLLEALQMVLKVHGNVELLVAGDGELRGQLERMCVHLNIRDHVHFLGFRDDVPDLLAASDIFVHPSLNEANSLAIMEAMGMAKPTIATDVGGNREIIVDGVNGLLVPPGAPRALAEKLDLLLRNEELALRLGTAAQRKIHEQFGMATMVGSYEEMFRGLCGKRPAGTTRYYP